MFQSTSTQCWNDATRTGTTKIDGKHEQKFGLRWGTTIMTTTAYGTQAFTLVPMSSLKYRSDRVLKTRSDDSRRVIVSIIASLSCSLV